MNAEEGKLINLENIGVPARTDKSIMALTKTTDFLPQIRVYGSESTIVKEAKFPMGHIGMYFAQDNIVDLNDAFDCLVIDWRPRVSIVMGDQPISYYGKFNEELKDWEFSKEFTMVQEKAMNKEQGYLAGLEYLLWVPSAEKFGLFLMGNPTLRRESSNLKALTGRAATIKVKLIKTTKYTWHGVQVFPCSTPFDLPDEESVILEVQKFREPKDSEMELSDGSSGSSRAR